MAHSAIDRAELIRLADFAASLYAACRTAERSTQPAINFAEECAKAGINLDNED